MDEQIANLWKLVFGEKNKLIQRLATNKYESVLFSILYLIGHIPWPAPS
jgi:hypothetical protein